MAAEPEVGKIIKLHAVKALFIRDCGVGIFVLSVVRRFYGFDVCAIRCFCRSASEKQRPGQQECDRSGGDDDDHAEPAKLFILEGG